MIFNLFLNRFLLIRHHITSNDYRLTIHTNFKKEYLSRFQLQNRSFASTGYPEDPENSFSRSRVKGFYTCSSRRYPKYANKTDDPYHFPALSWLLSRHHSESKTPSHPHHITIITQMSHRYPIDVPSISLRYPISYIGYDIYMISKVQISQKLRYTKTE